MDTRLVNQLLELNRTFYVRFAGAFSETRPSTQLSLTRILTYISNGVKVLDVGCGNGRVAQRLAQEQRRVSYLGLDLPEMVEIAAARCAGLAAQFRPVDITQPGWNQNLGAPFDIVLLLAVLHHIPGFDLRREVLRSVCAVLRPGGRLVMTNWQFARAERLRKKMVSWQTIGIDEHDLEPGDALLDWKRGGVGYRYCHLVTETEVEQLAAQSGFKVLEQFCADADLNLYSILIPSGEFLTFRHIVAI
jgi:2-polyprenyl-3-methyl-5-hydroxy-6-metoxy-1,4-benzoquinol methylase